MKSARLRPQAETDLIERSHHYLDAAGVAVAERFFDAAISGLRSVERMPGIGSPLVGELAGIPGLRMCRVAGFRCGWFYVVRDDHVDVVRLLADSQDLAAILGALDDEPGTAS